jgi:hypothetical protein
MNVNGVFTRREILDVNGDFDAFGSGRQRGGANALALNILDVHSDGLRGRRSATILRINQTGGRQEQRTANGSSHDGSPPGEWV